jgi:hypothetical protein
VGGIDRYPLYRALKGERENSINTERGIRLLLEYGADPNFNVKYDNILENIRRPVTMIERVILNANSKIVHVLLHHGAFLPHGHPYLLWPDEGTVLNHFFSASQPVNTPMMKRSMCRVLAKHAKSNESVSQFLCLSLVHMADKESCKILLNAGLNQVMAMNYAIEKENKLICQWLLELGVDIFKEGDHGVGGNDDSHFPVFPSPFQAAARLADTSILELFLQHWNERFAAKGGKDDNHDYPIHLLCCDRKASLSAIKLLAESQGDTLMLVDGQEGLLPFHFAAMWDAELDVIYTVLRHCPAAAFGDRR